MTALRSKRMQIAAALMAGLAAHAISGDLLAWQSKLPSTSSALPKWSYTGDRGPEHWGQIDPSFGRCATGNLQSPVPIDSRIVLHQPCEPLRFRYRSSSLYLLNDGNALRLGYDRDSYLVVDGLSYELVELRFHVPGQHAIDGRIPDGEIELIHGNNRGDIAIVSVPVEAGRRVNQTLRRILDNAPGAPGQKTNGRNIGVNALFLLPTRKSYFSYRGSLTRPPCQENVHWYVFDTPLEVDAPDLARLAQIVGPNARPLQALGHREVYHACAPGYD